MAYFPETIAAALAGRIVRMALLVKFDFASAPMRLWNGAGALNTGGFDWQGLGGLGKVEGLEQAMAGTAPLATFTVSGVSPALVSIAAGEKSEFIDRLAVVYVQFFDERWQTLDAPFPVYFGLMDAPQFDRPATRSPDEGATRTISIPCESLFAQGGRPRYGYYTDRDQQGRSPGDRFFERVGELQNKSLPWPV